ncbi:Efflux pump roqT [Penicillium atrosanguineum]|uniref:Efflux pump roqT n=1 Tax=Penicillium atrosanguineum TaxID=1132637 RepID=A0A9W9GXN1_9EURO|nr:Efflux pump roqT [Penicillium atrosanguineum]KAJ5137859.1 Efflux pump roqT [Penicillium atrosanguineum]KAJ5307417.1 Efflux pump roqT [Penicillium atrosanguineum]
MVVVLLVLRLPKNNQDRKLSFSHIAQELDLIGASLLIPAIICLILALQWGGNAYAWGSSQIIVLFVGFGLLILLFAASQIYISRQDENNAAKHQRLICNEFWTSGSAVHAATVVSSITIGAMVTAAGYYTPFLIGSTAIAAIGTSLITLYDVDISTLEA